MQWKIPDIRLSSIPNHQRACMSVNTGRPKALSHTKVGKYIQLKLSTHTDIQGSNISKQS